MSTKKHLLLLLAVCIAHLTMLAAPRSYQQAVKIAQQQAARLGISMDATPQAPTRTAVQDAAYYVIGNGQNKGYTIVSADDRLPAIVGYAVQGNYDESTLPAPYVEFITAYQKFAEAVKAGDTRAVRLAAEAQALRESSSYAQPTVAPLLGSIQWNQGSPYNNLCPEYQTGQRSATGCVATAMAQVMAYWKYPSQLQASTSAYTTKSNKISIPAIDKDAADTYDWNNMLPQYKTGQYNDTQANAVAKLMYHCGAAVQMDYGDESGAIVNAKHLATYFGYDKDLMMDLYRECFSMEQWNTLIDTELKAKRPVLYSGQSSGGGHQFVCDGADGNGLYHINWGWGGYQDGYFDITILNPEKGGIGSGNASDGFNRSSDMIIGIQPDNGKTDEPLTTIPPICVIYNESEHALALTTATRENATEAFSFTITDYFINYNSNTFNGRVAFGVKNADGTYTPVTDKAAFYGLLTGYWGGGSLQGSYAFPVGRTYLRAIYSTDGTTWNECAYKGLMPYAFDATETKLTIGSPLTAKVTTEEQLLAGQSCPMTLEVSNDADVDVIGTLNIYASANQTRPSSKDGSIYVSVPAKGKSVRDINVTVPAETFYLWVADANVDVNLVNGERFGAEQSGTPSFTLTQVTSNASDEYETEKAYYGTNKVKLPKVKDDKLTVTYNIQNNGGSAYCNWQVAGYNGQTFEYGASRSGTMLFPGGGTITSITASFTPEEIGCNSILCWLYPITDSSAENEYDISVTASRQRINAADNTGYFQLKYATQFMAYVEGTSTGMETVNISKTYIRGGHGQIDVTTDSDRTVIVYRLTGQKVAEVKARAGQAVSIPVTAGVYIVNGTKVAVK